MCFSPEASFGSALVVGGFAVATLPKLRQPRELLLGTLPLMFAAHQTLEGINWLALEGRVPPVMGQWSIYLYTLFAHALLPAIAPWCIWLDEPNPQHRRRMTPLLILGSCLCGFALWQLSEVGVVAIDRGRDIEYKDSLDTYWWFGLLYVVSTSAPPFFSSYPWMIAFGLLNLAGLAFTLWFEAIFLTSVWCFLASLISILVYLHFRRKRLIYPAPAARPAYFFPSRKASK